MPQNKDHFLLSFFKRQGGYVFASQIIVKILRFLLTFFVIRIFTKEDWGLITYAITIISFIVPFAGAGASQGILRFGSELNAFTAKKQLSKYALKKGLFISVIIASIIILLSGTIAGNLPESRIYIIIFSFLIIGLFILEIAKSYARLIHSNKFYAAIEIYFVAILFIVCLVLAFFSGPTWYAIAFVFIPIVLSFIFLSKLNLLSKAGVISLSKDLIKRFWKHSLYISFGNFIAQLLLFTDIFMIGNMLKDPESVALYKTSSFIPFSLLFLPGVFATTDYVNISRYSKQKKYLIKYLKGYFKLFAIISIVTWMIFWFGSEYIISIFGKEYAEGALIMQVFGIGIVGAFLFRTPIGNMLVALGWSKHNFILSTVMFVFNLLGNYFMIQKFGLLGAAITTSSIIWLYGVSAFFMLFVYIKKETL